LAQSRFDFNKLFYESVGYMSHSDHKLLKELKSLKPQPNPDSPECVIYCNSQYLTVKQWLDSIKDVKDYEKDPRNLLKLDVSFTRAKLFQSL